MAHISEKVVVSKARVVRGGLAGIERLPLNSQREFLEGPHMPAAGESYLRRALETLFDLGRHILAKGFDDPVPEYKAIARSLGMISRRVFPWIPEQKCGPCLGEPARLILRFVDHQPGRRGHS